MSHLATLLDTFPPEQRDSFGIFEVGFYLHNPVTEGGVPEAFQMAIDAAKQRKPYYILFGKQSDATGLYTRFWVDLELPLGGEFSCLNLISPSQGLRSDLEFKYQYQVNTKYTKLGTEPSVYATAISTTLDSLTARIHEIKECCDNQQKGAAGCGACVSTPEEIAQFFRDKGYVAIPIKILTLVSLKPDSLGAKPSAPGVDVCTDITSKEIDGTVCNDFPTVISNIVAEWPGGPAQAVITDNECMCYGGLESVWTLKHKPQLAYRLHIWRNPNPFESTLPDLLYTDVIIPNNIGELPFRGHMPIDITPQDLALIDKDYVIATAESIFAKNGFSIASFDIQLPASLSPLDLVNSLNYYKTNNNNPGVAVGRSKVDPNSKLTVTNESYLDFNGFVVVNNIIGRSFYLGYALAHEHLHQMVSKSYYYLDFTGSDFYGGHIDKTAGLMIAGDYWYANGEIECDDMIEVDGLKNEFGIKINERAKMNYYRKNNVAGMWLITQVFLGGRKSSITTRWERVSPNHLKIISYGQLLLRLEGKYGFVSCERLIGFNTLKRYAEKIILGTWAN